MRHYLLKPVKPAEAKPRLEAFLATLPKTRASGDGVVLLVEADPNFRAFATEQLSPHTAFEAIGSAHGALRRLQQAEPAVRAVLVGEGLALLDADGLAAKLRENAEAAGVKAPPVYLVTHHRQVPESRAALYAGIVTRSLVAKDLLAEFGRVVA